MSLFKDPAARARFIFREEMKPCPKCGSYNFKYQIPIVHKEPILAIDTAKQLVGKWARSIKDGHTPLEGPVFIMCFDCGHCGPALDCTGRTAEEVGKDRNVAIAVRKLWNGQEQI